MDREPLFPLPAHEIFRLTRSRAYCEVVRIVDAVVTPTPEMCALRVFGLMRSGEHEIAFVRLAQLFEQTVREGWKRGGVYRWVHSRRPRPTRFEEVLSKVDEFYASWDSKGFWRVVKRTMTGRELEFIAAVLINDGGSGFRLLNALADSLKLRGEWLHAYEIYLALCRVECSAALRNNVYALATDVHPAAVPGLLEAFGA